MNLRRRSKIKGRQMLVLWIFASLAFWSRAQSEPWFAFFDENELRGYRDSSGNVKISPQFSGLTSANVFRNVIMATEDLADRYESYYLSRNGRKFGRDSLYVLPDIYFDCEQEGHIRFHVQKTDKSGLFDGNGKVAVPAIYNDLTRVSQGYFIGLTGAQKVCWEGELYDPAHPCEHWSWKGGTWNLINLHNELLVADLPFREDFSTQLKSISEHPVDDTLLWCFKGTDQRYYLFDKPQKQFERWVHDSLMRMPNLLAQWLQPNILTWSDEEGVQQIRAENWLAANQAILMRVFVYMQAHPDLSYINPASDPEFDFYQQPESKQFFNDCSDFRREAFPVFEIMLQSSTKGDNMLASLEFIKTPQGYRLYKADVRGME